MRSKAIAISLFLIFTATNRLSSQIIYPQGGVIGGLTFQIAKDIMPEHGFLPGKKFPTYPTVNKFDFNKQKIKVILYDDRDLLKLTKTSCSEIPITNETELKGEQGIAKVWDYINSIFQQSNIIIDKDAPDELEIRLEALDCRLIGFGQIEVHGLCQIQFKYKDMDHSYCTNIEDGDKTAPLRKSSFVSRKTATRYMASASIRDTIEKFLIELKNPATK